MDENNDQEISLEEFLNNLNCVIPYLCLTGKKDEIFITEKFKDYDVNKDASMDKYEFIHYCNSICDLCGFARFVAAQTDYMFP